MSLGGFLWKHGPAASCIVLGVLVAFPVRIAMPVQGLDPSWAQVLQEAFLNRWQFGEDIVFTFGPLGALAVPYYEPTVWVFQVLFRALLGASLGWAALAIVQRIGWPRWAAPVAQLLLMPTLLAGDGIHLGVLFLWLHMALIQRDPQDRNMLGHFAALAALLALVKFTYFILAVGIALLVLVDDVWVRRRRPVPTLVFLVGVLFFWILAGQNLFNLPAWVLGSLQVTMAYSEGMGTPIGPLDGREILIFAAASFLLLGFLTWILKLRSGLRGALLPLLGLVFFLFLQFKMGFVRYGPHAQIALCAMPLFGVLLLAAATDVLTRQRVRMCTALLLPVCLATFAYSLRRHNAGLLPHSHYLQVYGDGVHALQMLASPGQTAAALNAARSQALTDVRAAQPLPAMKGGVDLYSYDQAFLLAHGVDYAPRPVFQSYCAYSKELALRNADSLARLPEHILMHPLCIDFRYPSSEDGRSWPKLLSEYVFKDMQGDFAHLVRARQIRSLKPRLVSEHTLAFGEDLSLAAHGDWVWAELEFESTFAGALLRTAFKPPTVWAEATAADGQKLNFRILPSVARGGMLLSPLVRTGGDFARLSRAEAFPLSQRVTRLKFDAEWLRDTAFSPRITVRLYTWTWE